MPSVPSDKFIETSGVYRKEESDMLMKWAGITFETMEGAGASPSSQEAAIAQGKCAPGLTQCWGPRSERARLESRQWGAEL